MRNKTWVLGVLLALVAGCASAQESTDAADEDTAVGDPAADASADGYCEAGGSATLRWAHEQEPPDLHLTDPGNQMSITAWIQQGLLESPYGIAEDITFTPELVADESVTELDDGRWRYEFALRDDVAWSDGEPLTAAHVKGTYDLIMEGYDPDTGEGGVLMYGARGALGYTSIDPESWVVDGQQYAFTAETFLPAYQALFDPVLPTHVLDDAAAANEALRGWQSGGEVLPSSGPLVFTSFTPQDSVELARNEDYHGAHPDHPDVANPGVACVDGVEINFVGDTDALVTALRAGEADIVYSLPDLAFGEQLTADEQFVVASAPGPAFEHWSLNLYDEHLADPAVREALALAMDKSAVVEALYDPLYGDVLPESGLGNVVWMANQPPYVDHAGEAGYGAGDVEAAAARLEEAGYARNDEGIFEHPERGELRLTAGTTGGNRFRELQIELLQAGYLEAGIAIEVDNVPGSEFFGARPFAPEAMECAMSGGQAGDCTVWDIAQFSWVGGAWPGGVSFNYQSGSPGNPYGYANEEFDALSAECDATVDPDERASCYNELNRYVTTTVVDPDGLVILPISQAPAFYAYDGEVFEEVAVAPDANSAGPLANVVDYLPSS